MNSRLSYLFANKVIGIDRKGDSNYAKIGVPLVDRQGNSERYFVYGRMGESVQGALRRAIGEDGRGECVVRGSEIGEYVEKIRFRGKDYENIQYYTDNGLPYAMLPNGKAYFLGGEEMVITPRLREVKVQDDTKYGTADLPGMIGAGGGGCPTSEQKALELKLEIWKTADERDLQRYSEASKGREPMLTEIQFVSAYLDASRAMDALQPGNFSAQFASPAQGGEAMVREAGQMAQSLSAAAANDARAGDSAAFGEEGEGPARFRRYLRAVRKFNSRMGKELGLAFVCEAEAGRWREEGALQQAAPKAVPLAPATQKSLIARAPENRKLQRGRANRRKRKRFVQARAAEESKVLDGGGRGARERKADVHAGKETRLKRANGAGAWCFGTERLNAAGARKKHGKPASDAKLRAKETNGALEARLLELGRAAGGRAGNIREGAAKEVKKAGPKGNPVSRPGFSVPERKTFEPLTYGYPRFPKLNPKTGDRVVETLRVRRSGQAELRARKRGTAIGLPELDKSSKGIILTERNKKQSSAPTAEVRSGNRAGSRKNRIAAFWARDERPGGSGAVSPFSAPNAGRIASGRRGKGRKGKKMGEGAKALWITGFSTSSSRRPRAARRAS